MTCKARERSNSDESPTVTGMLARIHQSAKQKQKSLESVKKIHAHPLYVMNFHGDYDCMAPQKKVSQSTADSGQRWACSLFVASGSKELPLYGRNFDWQHSPALLLFTDPADGYASVSMVDISYLGYARKDKKFDSLKGRENLLVAPMIPFDGMNEHGLTVGMAAVPNAKNSVDSSKSTVGSLQIIRIMLDKAKNVEEAVTLIRKHNIRFNGGPQIHYLIADATGKRLYELPMSPPKVLKALGG